MPLLTPLLQSGEFVTFCWPAHSPSNFRRVHCPLNRERRLVYFLPIIICSTGLKWAKGPCRSLVIRTSASSCCRARAAPGLEPLRMIAVFEGKDAVALCTRGNHSIGFFPGTLASTLLIQDSVISQGCN